MSLATAADRIGAIQTAIQDLRTPGASAPAPTTATTVTTAPAALTSAVGAAPPSAADFQSVLDAVLRGSAAGGDVTGSDVVAQAQKYLGVPYVFGGEDETGMDCSGLVQRVFADLGVDVPRVVQDQADIGTEVPSLDQARPGDLLVTQGEGHIVIYAGDGKIIHAPRPGKDVQLVENYLSPAEISTIRRVVPADAPAAPAAASAPAAAAAPPVPAEAGQLLSVMQSLFAAQATGLSSAVLS